ncbi:MAG: CCA tRNA nucleotidyltransferase [Pirellulales bacterium]
MFSPLVQREFAVKVVMQLRQAGYEALWAGGCVRDQLLGRTPKDYDVATSAHPNQVRALFGRRRTIPIGAAFGVISVLGGQQNHPIEVATFRNDGIYLDGRHPEKIIFSTAEEDAQRRDFTINGLFFDPLDERVIDYVHGQQDLEQHLIRAIGDPAARFGEDKLRMLRAVRFATTFNFHIDPPTLAAIQTMAAEITVVSAERIGAELRRVLVHPARRQGMQLMHKTNLLQPLFPELEEQAEVDGTRWQHTLAHLECLESSSLPVALAALLFETCLALEANNSDFVTTVGRRMRYTNKEVERARWLVSSLPQVANIPSTPWPQLQRLLVHAGAADLQVLSAAILGDEHCGVQACHEKLAWPAEQLNPEPFIAGADLIEHGIRPGPNFRHILDHVRDQQLLGNINNRQSALELVDQWMCEEQKE